MRHSSATVSSPRRPLSTKRIFSWVGNFRLVALRISRTLCSAPSGPLQDLSDVHRREAGTTQGFRWPPHGWARTRPTSVRDFRSYQRSGGGPLFVRYCDMNSEDKPATPQSRNQLARALARWDNEGGATASPSEDGGDGRTVLSGEELQILQCLGAAVISLWTELPVETQKALFEHAVSSSDPRQSAPLREQVARFLHNHKVDPIR